MLIFKAIRLGSHVLIRLVRVYFCVFQKQIELCGFGSYAMHMVIGSWALVEFECCLSVTRLLADCRRACLIPNCLLADFLPLVCLPTAHVACLSACLFACLLSICRFRLLTCLSVCRLSAASLLACLLVDCLSLVACLTYWPVACLLPAAAPPPCRYLTDVLP
jgi:hypothetical protein